MSRNPACWLGSYFPTEELIGLILDPEFVAEHVDFPAVVPDVVPRALGGIVVPDASPVVWGPPPVGGAVPTVNPLNSV